MNSKRKGNISTKMNNFILLIEMQGYEIKSNSLETKIQHGEILIKSKLLCNFTVKTDTVGISYKEL